jgi:hypothetical protein
MSDNFGAFMCGIMVATAVSAAIGDYHKKSDMKKANESSLAFSKLESDRKLSSSVFQDINSDGTNELIATDRSGKTTPLFLYNSKSNQYFSAETIREMKANELENQMRNYKNAEVGR